MARARSNSRFYEALGTRLKAARITAGFESAEAFAQVIREEGATYRKQERGESPPSLETLVEIARVTDYSLDWLIAGWGPPQRAKREG